MEKKIVECDIAINIEKKKQWNSDSIFYMNFNLLIFLNNQLIHVNNSIKIKLSPENPSKLNSKNVFSVRCHSVRFSTQISECFA